MTGRSSAAIEAIKSALEMELNGKEFYEKAASSCKTKMGREIFRHLAADELVHAERMKTVLRSLEGEGRWTNEWEKLQTEHGNLAEFFNDFIRKHAHDINPDAGDVDALNIGIDLEQGTIKYYENHIKTAADDVERAFLKRMISEERGHLAALSDLKFYLMDPDGWSFDQEQRNLDD